MTIVVFWPELYFAEITETTNILSPLLSSFLIHNVNKHTKAKKITQEKAVRWQNLQIDFLRLLKYQLN